MIRTTTAAVVLAGALALGTASATSLGTFEDVTFAAGDIDLQPCTLASDAITLVPELPTAGALTTDPLVDTATALLDVIEIDLSSLASTCIDDELIDVVIIGATDVLAVTEINPADAVASVLTLDVSGIAGLATIPDVTDVEEVRLVLGD